MHSSYIRLTRGSALSEAEVVQANASERTGDNRYTIGYEAEITRRTGYAIPNYSPSFGQERLLQYVEEDVQPLGYAVGNDAEYELKSPYAYFPTALEIATRGLIRTGWLTDGTHPSGSITLHVSFGAKARFAELRAKQSRFIHLLRIMEQMGDVTTSDRLLSPLTAVGRGRGAAATWNTEGVGGVRLADMGEEWDGRQRAEFCTLLYTSPAQLGAALLRTYCFSRALLSPPHSIAHATYAQLEARAQEHFTKYNLPKAPPSLFANPTGARIFRAYMQPYAEHLTSPGRIPLAALAATAVQQLSEEFHIPRP